MPAVHPGSLAVGLYDFYAASEFELSITPQQKLIIAPKKFQPTDCPGTNVIINFILSLKTNFLYFQKKKLMLIKFFKNRLVTSL